MNVAFSFWNKELIERLVNPSLSFDTLNIHVLLSNLVILVQTALPCTFSPCLAQIPG